MGIGQAALLGVLQGLTEFLPVSSSGHLAIVEHFLKGKSGEDVVAFVVAVHFGSLAAILTVLWRDVLRAFTTERRLLALLAVGTAPLIVLGKFMAGPTEAMFESLLVPGLGLIGTAIFLFVGDRLAADQTELKKAGWWDAAIVGLAQVAAMLPGLSRSGSTISSGLICGWKREDAVRYSFLLAVPAILMATAYKLWTAYGASRAEGAGALGIELWPVVAGMVAAYVFSVLAIRVMLKRIGRTRLSYFATYCLFVGVAVVALWFVGKGDIHLFREVWGR